MRSSEALRKITPVWPRRRLLTGLIVFCASSTENPVITQAHRHTKQGAMSDAAVIDVEVELWLRQVIGTRFRLLSDSDARAILAFLQLTNREQFFRPGEARREYLLDECDEYKLVLRIVPTGGWTSVRVTKRRSRRSRIVGA